MRAVELARNATESEHQIAVIDYAYMAKLHGFKKADLWRRAHKAPLGSYRFDYSLPMLEWLHAIPNGGARGDSSRSKAIRGKQLKAEGVKKGVYDLFLPFPANGYHGLYLELKTPERKPKTSRGGGGITPEQKVFGVYALEAGYQAKVVYGADEAIEALKEYLSGYE